MIGSKEGLEYRKEGSPKEWPTMVTLVAPFTDMAVFTAASTDAADLE
jgi:hypothetical protein